MTSRKFDDFDKYAKDYRDILDDSIGISGTDGEYFSEYKIVEIGNHENFEEELSILDFGCGDGNSSKYIRKHFVNSIIDGVDVSKDSIEIAQAKLELNANFVTFDGTQLPYNDSSFDVIFTSMVFHHIAHDLHDSILNEIYRVMKPRGRLYIFEHNPINPIVRKIVNECPFDDDAVLLMPRYCKKITEKAKFKNVKLSFTIFMPRNKLFIHAQKLEKYIKWLPIGAQYYIRGIK